jgi:hypothetical protein
MAQSGWLPLALGLAIFVLVGVWGMRQTLACFGGLIAAQLILIAALVPIAGALDPFHSTKAIAERLRRESKPEEMVVGYGISFENVLQTLTYYLGRRVAVFGDPGELTTGAGLDPDAAKWFAPEATAQTAMLQAPPGTWGITDQERWDALQQADPSDDFALIQRQGNLLLFRKIR